MMPSPAVLARAGKSGSQTVKQNSDSFGMFERYGRIFAPAGMMWSVVMLSPTLSTSSAASASAKGLLRGKGRMFGPRRTSTVSASAAGTGGSTARSSMRKLSGSVTAGISPSVCGSVMKPVSAAATAVSGDTR